MRFGPICLVASLLVASASAAPTNPKVHRGPTSPRAKTAAGKPKLASLSIDSERATQIQTALIKAGYLTGTPSKTWDANTVAAMGKLQADNGWQTKFIPDARAIIKLGLGSSYAPATYLATTPAAEAAETTAPATEAPGLPASK